MNKIYITLIIIGIIGILSLIVFFTYSSIKSTKPHHGVWTGYEEKSLDVNDDS